MSRISHRPAGIAEQAIGLEYFYTEDDGIGGRLRSIPEDFVVEEVSDYPEEKETSYLTAAVLRSYNWETNRLVRQLSRALRCSRRKIMFAGTKDKRAITTQLFVFEASLERVLDIRIRDVEILRAYPAARTIWIGTLFGNKFSIIVKELAMEQKAALEICGSVQDQIEKLGGFPNFFGVQRFGAVRPITHVMGKHIIRGNLELAVRDFLCITGEYEGEDATRAREEYAKSGDVHQALVDFPINLSFEKVILNNLLTSPDDYVGALESLPGNLLTMFVHAHQSYIFNKILSRRMQAGLPLNEPAPGDLILKIDKHGLPAHNDWVLAKERNIPRLTELIAQEKAFISAPLFGSESECAEGQPGEIEARILEDEGLEQKDFILPEFRRLRTKGNRREILAPVKDLGFEASGEDAVKFDFRLNKGCYATTLLREYMKCGELISY